MSTQTPRQQLKAETEILRILDSHSLNNFSKNLGKYRFENSCSCGFKFITDGHDPNNEGKVYEHFRHLASVVLAVFKDLPAMQEVPVRTYDTGIQMATYAEDRGIARENDLRRQILAELEEE